MDVSFHYQQAICRCTEESEYKENQTMIHLHIAGCSIGLCMDHTRELSERLSEVLRKVDMLDATNS